VATITFDTLSYAKKLKSAGFTDQQAEIQAEAFAEIIEERLASKQDLKELEASLKRDMGEIRRDMKEIEMRLAIRIGCMMAASIAIVAALVKLL
jgi:hypothetical protein